MRISKKRVVQKICVCIGIAFLTAAIVFLFLWRWNINKSEKQIEKYVHTLQNIIPQPQDATVEERKNNDMSVVSIDGTDFLGIIEMPRYNSALPVCASWGSISKYPCCFNGSIYDGTIQIGATTQKGQYDFYSELSLGDTIIYTDMEGNRYTFGITRLRNEKNINQATLNRNESDLTLFIKNIYSFEYLVAFCEVV